MSLYSYCNCHYRQAFKRSLFTSSKLCKPRFGHNVPSNNTQLNKIIKNKQLDIESDPTSILITRNTPKELYITISYKKPLFFGSLACLTTFGIAGYLYDRNQETVWRRWVNRVRHTQQQMDGAWWPARFRNRQPQPLGIEEEDIVVPLPSISEIWQERKELMIEKRRIFMEKTYEKLQKWQQIYGLPEGIKRLGIMVSTKYASMTDTERTMAGLVAINLLVFGAWQVPRWTNFMTRWFMHYPGSDRSITLLTSCFSHKEGLHLACNMVGLWSFGGLIHDYLGREQFLALYLTTGISANMASHVFSLALRRTRPLLPSLGASGAIYGLLSGTAYLEPQASVSLVFLPFLPIKLGYALPAMMGFDLAGILLKWKMFDHYAHLAGATVGIGYLAYGQQHIWKPLVANIHEFRSKQH
ncbi:unnamed protein product [Cunninghamella echinulata]